MDNNFNSIMVILTDEVDKELEAYSQCRKLMNKTYNPIKRIKLKRAMEMFSSHVAALRFAIIRINKEVKG